MHDAFPRRRHNYLSRFLGLVSSNVDVVVVVVEVDGETNEDEDVSAL